MFDVHKFYSTTAIIIYKLLAFNSCNRTRGIFPTNCLKTRQNAPDRVQFVFFRPPFFILLITLHRPNFSYLWSEKKPVLVMWIDANYNFLMSWNICSVCRIFGQLSKLKFLSNDTRMWARSISVLSSNPPFIFLTNVIFSDRWVT